MAGINIYLTTRAASYTPATLRGAWDQTANAVTKALDSSKAAGGTRTPITIAETSATDAWDVLLYRGVSEPLAAQTLGGSFDVCLAVMESSPSGNFCWHIHMYVTTGDSDTPRAVLVNDYAEATTHEWPASFYKFFGLVAPIALNQAVEAQDRLVVEIGYVARNTATSSYTGGLYYGTLDIDGMTELPDGVLGAGGQTTNAGFLIFSEAPTFFGASPTFNAAWARGSNVMIQPGREA